MKPGRAKLIEESRESGFLTVPEFNLQQKFTFPFLFARDPQSTSVQIFAHPNLFSDVTDRLLLKVLPRATVVALHLDHRRHADLVNLREVDLSTENYLVELAKDRDQRNDQKKRERTLFGSAASSTSLLLRPKPRWPLEHCTPRQESRHTFTEP